jgi:hypothetical protein
VTDPMASTMDYGTCTGCGGEYTLTKTGRIRRHNRDYEPCPGGGQPPRQETRHA